MELELYLEHVISHLPYTYKTPKGSIVHSREPMTISELHDHDDMMEAQDEKWANSYWDDEDEDSYIEDPDADGYGWERRALSNIY